MDVLIQLRFSLLGTPSLDPCSWSSSPPWTNFSSLCISLSFPHSITYSPTKTVTDPITLFDACITKLGQNNECLLHYNMSRIKVQRRRRPLISPSKMKLLVHDRNIKHGCQYLHKGAESSSEHGPPFLDTPRHPHEAQPGPYHPLHHQSHKILKQSSFL